MRYTETEAQMLLTRLEALKPESKETADEGPESKLQGKIVQYCKDNGWIVLPFRQTRKVRGVVPAGWPDLTIFQERKVVLMELKTGKGRQSEAQKQMALMFMALKHHVHVVRSFKRAKRILDNGK